MNTYPKITIVTPSYNQADYLEATLQSVLEQGYPNLEYIVMDGGSTDGSVEIIKKYADQLTYWKSAKDNGQADAIYRGFQRSTGEILGWLNSDDLLLPSSLEKVGTYFNAHPTIECVVGGCVMIGSNGKPLRCRLDLPICNLGTRVTFHKLLFWGGGGFSQAASFWKREAFFAVGGFDTELLFCFDYDLYLKLAKRRSFGRIRDFLASYRLHPTSKTTTIQDVCAAENELLWRKCGRYKRSRLYRDVAFSWYARSARLRQRIIQAKLLFRVLKCPL